MSNDTSLVTIQVTEKHLEPRTNLDRNISPLERAINDVLAEGWHCEDDSGYNGLLLQFESPVPHSHNHKAEIDREIRYRIQFAYPFTGIVDDEMSAWYSGDAKPFSFDLVIPVECLKKELKTEQS